MFGQNSLNDSQLALLANWTPYSIAGGNPDIDLTTLPEDIWNGGGTFQLPTAARIHAIASTSANDKGTATAGPGCRTVQVNGIDGSYNLVTEAVTLNGTTPVNTSGSYLWLEIIGQTFGSDGINDGVITATAATDGTVTARMAVGQKKSSGTSFIVPAGYTAHVLRWFASMQCSTAGARASVSLIWLLNGSLVAKSFQVVIGRENGRRIIEKRLESPLVLPEKTIIKCKVDDVTADNISVVAGYDLILVAD